MHGGSGSGGGGGGGDVDHSRGVVPRAMEVVFGQIQAEKQRGTARIELAISCLEIYQEKLFDLLIQDENTGRAPGNGNANHSNLRIRQRQNGEVWVEVSWGWVAWVFEDIHYVYDRASGACCFLSSMGTESILLCGHSCFHLNNLIIYIYILLLLHVYMCVSMCVVDRA